MTNSKSLQSIHWEVSSACQAMCPCCVRKNSTGALADFRQTYTAVEQVEKTLEGINWIGQISFCGNIGDPMANPDIVKIAAHVRATQREDCSIQINTNGGIGSVDNFARLAEIGVRMVFGVDGTAGVNELHRYNVKFNQIDRNIRAFVGNKAHEHSTVIVQFLVWDQNIGNLPDMVSWCRNVGVDFLQIRESNGLGVETPIANNQGTIVHRLTKKNTQGYRSLLNREFSAEKFDQLLEEWNQLAVNVSEPLVNPVQDQSVEVLPFFPKSKYQTQPLLNQAPWPIDPIQQEEDQLAKTFPVRCISLLEDRQTSIFISHDGYVFPCCFIGTSFAQAQIKERTSVSLINRLVELGLDRFNTHVHSLADILDDTVLDELAYAKLHTNDKLAFCGQTCKVADNPSMTYRNLGLSENQHH